MKSKKFKPAVAPKAGKYIRCYVNCIGEAVFEVVEIFGASYKYKREDASQSKFLRDRYVVKSSKSRWERTYSFVSDLGFTKGCQHINEYGITRIFRFSNKLQLKLKALYADPWAFIEFLNGCKVPQYLRKSLQADWAFARRADEDFHRALDM